MKPIRIAAFMFVAFASAALSGCGEEPQMITGPDNVQGNRVKNEKNLAPPWEGNALVFQTGTFKRGDEAGWNKAIDTRTQAQNEYIRIGGAQ